MIRYTNAEIPAQLVVRTAEAFADLRDRLREWADGVLAALRALPRVEVRALPFIGGQTDLEVAADFRVSAVLLGGVRIAGSGAAVGTGVTIDWDPRDDGYRVRSVAGLTSGTQYVLTLVAMGAE